MEHVSVLICSRERPQLLLDTIQSILTGDTLPSEIVVVDQSHAPHQALANWQGPVPLRYLHSCSIGLSRARNEAIRAASGDLLVIIDDDMYVEKDWLRSLVAAQEQEGPGGVVTGRVLPDAASDKSAGARGGFVPALVTGIESARYRGRLPHDVLAGGNMASYRRTLEAVGGFDERLGAGSRFPAADDNDLGYRLLAYGYEIVYVPEAVVYHRAWRPKSEYLSLRWRYGRGKGAFYARHLWTSEGYMLGRMARDVGRRALGFPRRFARDPHGAAGDVVYTLGVLSGAVEWSLGRPKIR